MKKLLYIFIAAAIFASCEKAEKGLGRIAGEWVCTPSDMEAEIYTNFAADGTFELYQQITEGAHRLYRGTWSVADKQQGIITGKYNDGEAWASYYVVSFNKKGDVMTLSPVEVTTPVEYTYVRTTIPEEVRENCVIVVKSPYAY